MNPNHLIKAELVPELDNQCSLVYSKDLMGRLIQTEFDLSDRATFLLALDVLMRRFEKMHPDVKIKTWWNTDLRWSVYRAQSGKFFVCTDETDDPIHALKLALDVTSVTA